MPPRGSLTWINVIKRQKIVARHVEHEAAPIEAVQGAAAIRLTNM
jgi:hypothetical protein